MSSFLVRKGLTPDYHGQDYQKERKKMEGRVPGITAWIDSLTQAGIIRDTFMIKDGFRLHSYYARAQYESKKTAIVLHGYSVNPTNIMMLARMYRDSLGYNVWMPSLRYHGKSEGLYIQMGWGDRLDLLDWSAMAHDFFQDTLQVFHGMSMGAATVMMASGEDTESYVRGFVEDCGFACLSDEFDYVLKNKVHLPSHPLIENVSYKVHDLYGWDVADVSSVRQLAKCAKPMLFIHGSADKLVPPINAQRCFDAKTKGYKELWIAPDSGHSMSFPDHPDEYVCRVRKFLCEHVE